MKIGIVHSFWDQHGNKEVVQDLKGMANAAYDALKKGGFDPLFIDIEKLGFDGVQKEQFHILFNVCERLDGDADKEPFVAFQFEKRGIPFTGNPGSVLEQCNDKRNIKKIAKEHGIQVPVYLIADLQKEMELDSLSFPVIVKPCASHSSIGITKDALAYSKEEAQQNIKNILDIYNQPSLVEEFIPGKDIEISIIGNNPALEVLHPVEVYYPMLKGKRPLIFSYESKWHKTAEIYGDYRPVQDVSEEKLDEMIEITKKCFSLFGLRDYGRVDFRLHDNGEIYVIEVTANPGLSLESSTIRSAKAMGMDHHDVILKIFRIALERVKKEKI